MAKYIVGFNYSYVPFQLRRVNIEDNTYSSISFNGSSTTVIGVDDNYIYTKDTASGYLAKYDVNTLTKILVATGITSTAGGWDMNTMSDIDYLYYMVNNQLYKIRKSDLVVVNTLANWTGYDDFVFLVYGDYIYHLHSNYYISKIRKSDLTNVITNYSINDDVDNWVGCAICTDGNYLYLGGTNGKQGVLKYDFDLNYIGKSTAGAPYGFVYKMVVDNEYIYIRGNSGASSSVTKWNKNDLSYVGNTVMLADTSTKQQLFLIDDYLYAGGDKHGCYKINKNDLSVIGKVAPLEYYVSQGRAMATNQRQLFTLIAPTGLTLTNINCNGVRLNWVNNNTGNTLQNVIQLYGGSTWTDYAIVSSGDTYCDVAILPSTSIQLRVCAVDATNGDYYWSESIIATTLTCYPPSFCETAPYTVSASTCGNADGIITIIDNINYQSYFTYYDFTLVDIDGTSYSFNSLTGEATGLTANYYFLTATVKPAYWYYYGRETCTFEWIEVIDTDTTMSNTGVSIKNSVCGGFGKSQGRIAYLCTDSGSNPIYTAKLYNKETYDLVQTVTGTTIDLIIFSPLNAGDYYCHITNDAGCSLLIGATKVQGQSLRSVAGIKKLWLTQWDENVEYDYWAQSDDDYYLSGIDADFFNSIKIKRFIDSTLPDVWYSVNVQTKAITFSQTMEKTKQGFVFNDKLALTIPEADNTKWKELVDILQNRYILIFLDNNGYYWCMGYRHGASTDGYKRENNEYILEFNAISENKILTNIDKQYIIDSIL